MKWRIIYEVTKDVVKEYDMKYEVENYGTKNHETRSNGVEDYEVKSNEREKPMSVVILARVPIQSWEK